jgi:hypothetical protein
MKRLRRKRPQREKSEAKLTRDAIATAVARPRPRGGLISVEPFSQRVDELLAGFGSR